MIKLKYKILLIFSCLFIMPSAFAKSKPDLMINGKNALKSLFVKIDNCRPVFEWIEFRQGAEVSNTYEMSVRTAINGRGDSLPLGEQIFSKEGITNLRVALDADLKPDTKYFWSIRLKRSDDSATKWLTHFASKNIFIANIEYSHIWPGFKTPKLCNK